jgi:hypothetical protein
MPYNKELFQVLKLTKENYKLWFRQMKIQLEQTRELYTVEQILIEYPKVAIVGNFMSSIQSNLEQLKLSKKNIIYLNIEKKLK